MSLLSSVYSKRCFPDQERLLGVLTGQENIFLPSASLFSFRPLSIQGDVFYDQEMVNRPQWITTSEADTDSRLSIPGWSWVLNGPSLTMEVNIYPKKCQYPGSETVWYKNVRKMDFSWIFGRQWFFELSEQSPAILSIFGFRRGLYINFCLIL